MTHAATFDYDLVVIGSGPAGEKGAAQAAYFGKRVALVEARPPLGGTCVHWGTLPSKSLRESAQHLSGLKTRGIAGIGSERSQTGCKLESLIAHKEAVAASEAARIVANLERHKVELVIGRATFADAHTIQVALPDGGTRTLTTRFALVATGSRPFHPSTIPFENESIWDSDEVLSLDRVPSSMIVVGAGVIGSEYAAMFAALGTKVTLLEPRDAVLPFLDEEVRDALVDAFVRAGIDIRLGVKVERAELDADGHVVAHLEGGGTIAAERLLFAAGRVGNSAGLGLEALGVGVDKRGQVQVDASYRTAVPSIYAAGDLIGFPALASTSMEQARIAMCHAFDLGYKTALAQNLPYGIYTIPEVSMVGETSQALRERGEPFEIGKSLYRDNARGKICGHQEGMIKLVFAPDSKKLLGAHIVGENAAELIHVALTVMQFGGGIDAFIDACYNYPTLSEVYKYAAYDGLGRLARRRREAAAAAAAPSTAPTHTA